MKDKLIKQYNIFDAKERINLSIAALARNDDKELSQLQNTCPKRKYIMADARYFFGMDKIKRVCLAYISLCEEANNKISICHFLISVLEDLMFAYADGFNSAIKDIGSNYKPSKKTITKKEKELKKYQLLIDEIGQYFNKRVTELKAIHEAFKDFCEKEGINYKYAYELIAKTGAFELSDRIDFMAFDIDMALKEKVAKSFLDRMSD